MVAGRCVFAVRAAEHIAPCEILVAGSGASCTEVHGQLPRIAAPTVGRGIAFGIPRTRAAVRKAVRGLSVAQSSVKLRHGPTKRRKRVIERKKTAVVAVLPVDARTVTVTPPDGNALVNVLCCDIRCGGSAALDGRSDVAKLVVSVSVITARSRPGIIAGINFVVKAGIRRKQMHGRLLTGGILDLAAGIAGDHPKAIRRRFVGRDPEALHTGLVCGRRCVRSLEPAERNEVGFQLHTYRRGMRVVGCIGFCDLTLLEGDTVDHDICTDRVREGRIACILVLIVCKPLIDGQTDVVGCRRHLSFPFQGIIARVHQKRVDIREVELDICAIPLVIAVDLIDQVLEAADDLLRRRLVAVRTGAAAVEPFLQIGKQGMENVVCADLDEDLLNARDLKRIHLEARCQCRALQRALELSRAILKQLVALDGGGDDGDVVNAVFLKVILKHVRDGVGDGGVADKHGRVGIRAGHYVDLLQKRQKVIVALAVIDRNKVCRVADETQIQIVCDITALKPCGTAGQSKVTNIFRGSAIDVDDQRASFGDRIREGEENILRRLGGNTEARFAIRCLCAHGRAAGLSAQAFRTLQADRDFVDRKRTGAIVIGQRHAEILAAELRRNLNTECSTSACCERADRADCLCRLTVFCCVQDASMPCCDPVL